MQEVLPVSRARVLSSAELRQLLAFVSRRRHALRNATQILLTYWAGMRVGEIAALRYDDVVDANRRIRLQVSVPQGAGRPPRMALLSARMRRQLAIYINAFPPSAPGQPLFYTQKRTGWSANTLTQHFFHLYRAAGLEGSSHSGRRTFISSLAHRGVHLEVMRSLAGHRRVAATRAAIAQGDAARDAIEHL